MVDARRNYPCPEGHSGSHHETGQYPSLKGLTAADRAALLKEMQVRPYSSGSMVFGPGTASAESLYYLVSGRVVVYLLAANGKRLVTRRIFPDSVFGPRGLFGLNSCDDFAEAVGDCSIGMMRRDRAMDYLRSHPDLVLRLLRELSSRVAVLEQGMLSAFFSPVRIRIACFLLEQSDAHSGLLPNITHEEIGDRIGAIRPTVSKTLGLLQEQGVIQVTHRQIRVVDRQALERICSSVQG